MAATQAFHQAVQNGDILSVHIMMKDSLLRDPSFKEFSEMESIAGNMSGLYEPHNGVVLNSNKSAWNDTYMNELMVDLIDNFSHERVELLKQIIRYLHPYTENEKENLRRIEAERQTQQRQQQMQTEVPASAVIGGLVGGGIAAVTGASAVPLVISGAAVGAVVAIVKNNGGK